METAQWPRIIQGGMGVAISGWRLAKTVSQHGSLGVVSGTGLNIVFAERLQLGDEGGHLRRALEHFPFPSVAEDILCSHYNVHRRTGRAAVRGVPMFTLHSTKALRQLTVAANFCEVYLAKEGHDGEVGINLLEKVQLPNLYSLYGAMLAGVDYVLMGAGIPREIPGVLDHLAKHEAASLKLQVEGALPDDDTRVVLDPRELFTEAIAPLRRPKFIAIVSSDVLAQVLVQKASGRIDGLVVENHLAGGHNAPPRGAMKYSEDGEPVYGTRDSANIEKIRELGLPFWLAGDYAGPERLQQALDVGATGIQVGTDFAFCEESGLDPVLRTRTLEMVASGDVEVFTDPVASSTGFPFKVVQLSGTLSDENVYEERPRICQVGLLRRMYRMADGKIGYRCPGEPVNNYVRKGGSVEETSGRKCLCNALLANAGLPQEQTSGYIEKPLLTAGISLQRLKRYLKNGALSYSALAVLEYILSPVSAASAV